ncbi:MAG TPA: carboxypeptidase regulatory-like domain-containing protein, partial [Verrucomicrobiae bacterium]|nr:carboxypeptidase regulatory-like domain-containing protein [Verrucomicrobiae bacterium]
ATTTSQGTYRFSLLQPGVYTVGVSVSGFQPASHRVQVTVGQVATANIQLSVSGAVTTVDVTTSVLQVENADNSTGFNSEQISQVPNPGNDLSAVALTAPGVVLNTGGGFGNFSAFGLPGTSNLFTLNGMNDNDPFLNLNNSGATNLLLGANELEEATVVTNGYSGQYGQLAGAQINYITKSGGNQWHGNAAYWWNGRAMNANNYFNNLQVNGNPSTPKPFDNVNQWAVSFGGPIRKDKTFFFFNYEGLRVVLPTSSPAFIPSQQFQAAALANVAGNPAQVAFYQNMFHLYNTAPGAAAATTSSNCGDAGVSGGALLPATPCISTFQSTAGNFTHEYLMALRLDHHFSDSDKIYGRAQVDRGVQATFTDQINPVFNAVSTQPEFQAQIGWTHVFGSSAVNEFKVSDLWYSALFSTPNLKASLAAFPTTMILNDGSLSGLGGIDLVWPQGRNVNQYQIVDDYQMTRGKHTWKFGVNYHRDNVTDFDYGVNTSGTLVELSMQSIFDGTVDFYQQAFNTRASQPIATYSLGFYAGDEWRVTKKLKLGLTLRADHNSNPVCQTNCFARLTVPFTTLAQNATADTLPYNQVIKTGLHQAYPSTDMVVWQPRLGFTWSPFSDNKTVLSGGIGIFTDSFPAAVVDGFSQNSPLFNTFTLGTLFGTTNSNLSAASDPTSIFSSASGQNQTFVSGFAAGKTSAQLGGVTPGLTSSDKEIRQPRYQEWNLKIERELPWSTVLGVNYVGNHGIFEVVANSGVNAIGGGFVGLPVTAPDDAFGAVTQYQSIAVSNTNALAVGLQHNFRGFQIAANYTWQHALDEVSNAGLFKYNQGTAASIGTLVNPFNLRANYGNADYDIRHNFTASYLWDNSLRHLFKWGPNAIFSGWNFSGKIFAHSGSPFSVIDSGTTGGLLNYTGPVLANIIGPTKGAVSCGNGSTNTAGTGITPVPCLNKAGFNAPGSLTGFGNQARNQFRGPGYVDTDFAVVKHTKLPRVERGELNVGFQFFNLFNHPNFDNPVNDVASSRFGRVTRTVNTPTSILGSFLGGDASPRIIQLKAEFKF